MTHRPLLTRAHIQRLDQRTINDLGIDAFTLMETAGRAVANHVLGVVGKPRHVVVACGPGSNGGDGYVVARVLADRGITSTVIALDAQRSKGAAGQHLKLLHALEITVVDVGSSPNVVAQLINSADVVVDALFGVGLTRPIDGHAGQLIAMINACSAVRVSVDLPSGLCADTGATLGVCVNAGHTVAIAAEKVGMAMTPGWRTCGEVVVVDIGIPTAWIAQSARAFRLTMGGVRSLVPVAASTDHKGSRGRVVTIGGSRGMRGAGRLASIAALRSGAGVSTWATIDSTARGPAPVMSQRIDFANLAALFGAKSAFVIGPGLGRSDDARKLVAAAELAAVTVFDADALHLLAHRHLAPGRRVLSPHPGEAAVLLQTSIEQVETNRVAAAREIASRFAAVVALKGSRTTIAAPDGQVWINPYDSAALATAGSGDVLAGTIGGFLAQGLSAVAATCLGVVVHGLAAQQLAKRHGGRGVIASDLPRAIARAIASLDFTKATGTHVRAMVL